MISLLKKSSFGEEEMKLSLETSNGLNVKFKRRKVSVVRDFPAGCGPNAPKVNAVKDFLAVSGSNAAKVSAIGDFPAVSGPNAPKVSAVGDSPAGSGLIAPKVYAVRRVFSVVRDFPPGCGPGAKTKLQSPRRSCKDQL